MDGDGQSTQQRRSSSAVELERRDSKSRSADVGAYTLTDDEEAALLAEFGVAGAYDDLLAVPAASHFRSDVHGGVNVFLTGGVADADGGSTASNVNESGGCNATAAELLHAPLDALLLKYTSALCEAAPNALLDDISAAVKGATTRRRHSLNDSSATAATSAAPSCVDAVGNPKYSRALMAAREQERHAFRVVCAWGESLDDSVRTPAAQSCDDAALDPTLLQESDQLLARARDVLLLPTHVDCATDNELNQRLAQLEEALSKEAREDFDEVLEREMDAVETEKEGVMKATEVLLNRYDDVKTAVVQSLDVPAAPESAETSENPQRKRAASNSHGTTDGVRRRSTVAQSPVEPSLFAFEAEPCSEEVNEIQEWDRIREHAAVVAAGAGRLTNAPLDAVTNVAESTTVTGQHSTVPAVADSNSDKPPSTDNQGRRHSTDPKEVLAHLDVLEGRQTAALTAIEAHYRVRLATVKTDTEQRRQRQAKEGFLVLDPFQQRVEQLLPSTHSTVQQEKGVVSMPHADRAPSEQAGQRKNGAAEPQSSAAIADIQRRAERQLWQLQRETMEAKCMRQEDNLASRRVAERERALEAATEALLAAAREAEELYQSLLLDETAAFEELLKREGRHRELTRRALSIRETKAAVALAQSVTASYEGSVRQLYEEEAAAWGALIAQEGTSHASAAARQAAREEAERAALLAAERERRVAFVAMKESHAARGEMEFTRQQPDNEWDDVLGCPLAVARAKLLRAEESAVGAWVRANSKRLKDALASLEEELSAATPAAQGGGAHSPRTVQRQLCGDDEQSRCDVRTNSGDGKRCGDSGVLDAARLAGLLHRQFASASQDPSRAAHYFHTVFLALDEIRRMDYASLARCTLTGPLADSNGESHVANFVRVLDLGSNQLSDALSLPALLQTFPSLEELNLSDNGLSSLLALDTDDNGAEDEEHLSRPRSRRQASLSASCRLRGVTAARQNAQAERCRLRELNLSANALRDLSPLVEHVSASLVKLVVVANQLTSLSPLQSCSRLASLSANRNRISSLHELQSLILLQELNLCDNHLSALPGEVPQNHVLLTKLFLSGNRALSALPCGGECFLFLEQLFLNHCALTSISEDNFPWMPSLSVLHVEGNGLTTVAGIVKCPRLRQLNVAFNALQTVLAVAPLRLCSRLESIDLRGNPCMSAAAEECVHLVRSSFPCLREVNNEPCTALLEEVTAAVPQDGLSDGAFDSLMTDLRTTREVTSIYGTKRVREAEAAEEHLAESNKANGVTSPLRGVVGKQFSLEMKRQAYRSDVKALHDSLARIVTVVLPGECGTSAIVNRHFVYPVYAEKRRLAAERDARATVAAFLLGVVKVRQAKALLAVLRAAHRESEAYRREMAVRRIQPVWRGAALRSRLARFLKPGTETDMDDGEFRKVDLQFDHDADALLRPTGVAELLRQALATKGSESSPGANNVLFHRFDVPATVVNPTSGRTPEPNKGSGGVPTLQQTPRARATPAGTGASTSQHGADPRRPPDNFSRPLSSRNSVARAKPALVPQPQRLTSATSQATDATRSSRPPTSGSTHLPQQVPSPATEPDPAWGASVAAQIRKKTKKMQRAHQEYVRNEFLQNPLHAKKMERAGASGAPARKP